MIDGENNLARFFVLYGQIGAKLRELGHDTQMRFQVDGVACPFDITVDGTATYRSVCEPYKIRVQVHSQYGDKKQFPQRKAGFDIDKIAQTISESVKGRLAAMDREYTRRITTKTNEAIVEKVGRDEGLLKEGDGSFYGTVYADPLKIESGGHGIQVTLTLRDIQGEDALREILAKLKATGLTEK
jgi:hypothetical protein